MRGAWGAVLALCVVAPVVQAQDNGQMYFAAGRFSPANNSQFTNPRGTFGAAVGGGGRFSPRLSWDVDLSFSRFSVDLPAGFSGTPRATVETWGLGGIIKATLPLGPFEPYAGAGAGVYSSTLTARRPTSLTTNEDVKRNDEQIGVLFVAGIDLRTSPKGAIGFQWRKLDTKMQFAPEVAGKVNVGGSFGLLHLRANF